MEGESHDINCWIGSVHSLVIKWDCFPPYLEDIAIQTYNLF